MKRKGAISRIVLAALVAFSMSMPAPALAEMSAEFGVLRHRGLQKHLAPRLLQKRRRTTVYLLSHPLSQMSRRMITPSMKKLARRKTPQQRHLQASLLKVPPTLKQNLKKLKSRLRPRKTLRRTLSKKLGQQLLLTALR